MNVRQYSEGEVVALHNRVRELSKELQLVLDELLDRVMTAMREGNDADAARAISQIQSIRDDDSGTGGRGEGDSGPVESDERRDAPSTDGGGDS